MSSARPLVFACVALVACNPAQPDRGGGANASSTTTTSAAAQPEAPKPEPPQPEPPQPEPEPPNPYDPGPGKPADPPSQAELAAEPPSESPASDFWTLGAAACEPGGRLEGAVPPEGREIRCVNAEGLWSGMEALFHENGQLASVGARREGRAVGVWLTFDASGARIGEQPYVDGQLHGTARRWSPQGQELESAEYRVGRPWGLFVTRDASGKELARSQLQQGTGKLVQVDNYGRRESDYVNGLLHGKYRRYDLRGNLLEETTWSGGEWHGKQTQWDPSGQRIGESWWKQGLQHGLATRWLGGVIVEQSLFLEGQPVHRQLYREGKPLVPTPSPSACDTKDGLSAALLAARGQGLDEENGCMTRLALFPGVVLLGSFAHDRGCMEPEWVVDCKLVAATPSAADVLARAGWANASPDQRLLIAQEYMTFAIEWSGSISWTPDQPTWTNTPEGGVEGIVWIVEPGGMQPGRELDKVKFAFAADGTLTRTQLEHRSEPGL